MSSSIVGSRDLDVVVVSCVVVVVLIVEVFSVDVVIVLAAIF